MNYLFIDASYSLSVGILDSTWQWIKYENTDELPSQKLHSKIQKFLEGKKLKELEGVIFCKGPGSYTGLRLVEGFEQFLRFEKIPCFDFYSFELRKILNINESFLYSAFKKEYLLYGDDKKTIEISEINKDEKYYSDGMKSNLNINTISISDLIRTSPEKIFPYLLENEKKEIFYFRPLHEEFKK